LAKLPLLTNMKKTLQTIAAIAIFSTASLAQRTLLHCGTFIDVTKGNTQSQVTVIVEGKRVTGVQTGYLAPKGTDKVIDLKSKTVMPGLTDMHVHIEGETSKDQLVKRYQFNQADVALKQLVMPRLRSWLDLPQCVTWAVRV
jgi:adenine deaminase